MEWSALCEEFARCVVSAESAAQNVADGLAAAASNDDDDGMYILLLLLNCSSWHYLNVAYQSTLQGVQRRTRWPPSTPSSTAPLPLSTGNSSNFTAD